MVIAGIFARGKSLRGLVAVTHEAGFSGWVGMAANRRRLYFNGTVSRDSSQTKIARTKWAISTRYSMAWHVVSREADAELLIPHANLYRKF